MASTFPSRLQEISWDRQVEKNSFPCQVCGKLPKLDRHETIERGGLTLFIACPERHGMIEVHLPSLPVGIPSAYEAQANAIHTLVAEWNTGQQEARNAQMFPGKKA